LRVVAPYGSWESPVTPAAVVGAAVGVSEPRGAGRDLYWLESRPSEAGRVVVMRRSADGATTEVTPGGYSARTRVHEYGGGAYTVVGDTVVFSNFADQRLWSQRPGADPVPVTPEPPRAGAVRYADGCPGADGRLVCVRETHGDPDTPATVVNELVAVTLSDGPGGEAAVLHSGHDFYAAPRLDPGGSLLAWLTWDHPNMPWDGSDLWTAELSEDGLVGIAHIAGGPAESVLQPRFGPDGELWYVSDRTGWWRLHRAGVDEPVVDLEADFAPPAWVFAQSSYVPLGDGRLACSWSADGTDHVGILDPRSGRLEEADLGYTSVEVVVGWDDRVVVLGATPVSGRELAALDPDTGERQVIRPAEETGLGSEDLSRPRPIDFASAGGRLSHALYYPPTNASFRAPPGERPPLLVLSHGGPTGAARPLLQLGLQFWTSRGFAVVDVNYGGSTGYGRAYRDLLAGQWGVVDAEDCLAAARHLVATGEADGGRLVARGSSAGGYTTLRVLTTTDEFAAGASYYGVADLEALARDAHKFESHYTDILVGPYPEARELYRDRSPVDHTEDLSCPVILLQGAEDEIVPPRQAEAMADALRRRGIPFAHLVFEKEQHGFRRAETMVAALEAELSFYGQVLGFTPAGDVPPVAIERP
jgi:dipeptidyl aminopeptidase/acylaminoacyl peptidase